MERGIPSEGWFAHCQRAAGMARSLILFVTATQIRSSDGSSMKKLANDPARGVAIRQLMLTPNNDKVKRPYLRLSRRSNNNTTIHHPL